MKRLALVVAFFACGCTSVRTSRGVSISEPNSVPTTRVQSNGNRNERPSITIPGASKKSVIDALSGRMTAQGFRIILIEDYRAQFEKEGGFWADMLFGSRYDSRTVWRVWFSLFDSPEGVRIFADMGAVTNPGSAFERINEIRGGKNGAAMQEVLEAVKDETARIGAPEPALRDTLGRD
jgi:hypothetical protein